jgi:hypothetical protein
MEYEKKLNTSIVNILENKVSSLMAELDKIMKQNKNHLLAIN